jgi:hypothetical protein
VLALTPSTLSSRSNDCRRPAVDYDPVHQINSVARLPALSAQRHGSSVSSTPYPLWGLSASPSIAELGRCDEDWISRVLTFSRSSAVPDYREVRSMRLAVRRAVARAEIPGDEPDWSRSWLLANGYDEVVSRADEPRCVSPSLMAKCIAGQATMLEMFSAEGQAVRCMAACDSHDRRSAFLLLWVLVATALQSSAFRLRYFYDALGVAEELNAGDMSCVLPISSLLSAWRMTLTAGEYLSFWGGVFQHMDSFRTETWRGLASDLPLCGIHIQSCLDTGTNNSTLARQDVYSPL